MKKKNIIRIILYSLVFLPIIIGVLSGFHRGECNIAKEIFVKQEVIGTVKNKYIAKNNHNNEIVILRNGKSFHFTSRISRKAFEELEVGDSIYKLKNSRLLKLFKKNGDVLEYLENEKDCDFLLKE